jgi:hypothetical protein
VNPLADFFDKDYWETDFMMPAGSLAYKHELDLLDLNDRLTCNDKSPSALSSVLCLSPHQTPPSREERYECYARLNHDLGPPCGIQQLVGSYQMYMKEQTQLYYERLFSDFGSQQAGMGKRHPVACHGSSSSQHSSTPGGCFTYQHIGTGLTNRTSCGRPGLPTKNDPVPATQLNSKASDSTPAVTATPRVVSSTFASRSPSYPDKHALNRLERTPVERSGYLMNFA